jgi:hypothetical protein
VCICVLHYCHRVATQLQLTYIISYHIKLHEVITQKTTTEGYTRTGNLVALLYTDTATVHYFVVEVSSLVGQLSFGKQFRGFSKIAVPSSVTLRKRWNSSSSDTEQRPGCTALRTSKSCNTAQNLQRCCIVTPQLTYLTNTNSLP